MPNGFAMPAGRQGRGMGWRRGWGRGWGRGRGFGGGRGWCWGPQPRSYGATVYEPYSYPYQPAKEDLQEEIEMLREEKTDIDTRLQEIEQMLKQSKKEVK